MLIDPNHILKILKSKIKKLRVLFGGSIEEILFKREKYGMISQTKIQCVFISKALITLNALYTKTLFVLIPTFQVIS